MIILLEECELDNLSCIRYCLLFSISLLVAIISTYWSYKHYKDHKEFYYEIAPMLSCSLQAILHTIQYSIYNCNQLIILTSFIELITFAFISQSLANLCYRIEYTNDKIRKQKYRKLYTFKGIVYGLIFMLQVVLMGFVNEKGCNNQFFWSLWLVLFQLFFTTLFTLIYGYKLVNFIKRRTKEQNKQFLINLNDSVVGTTDQSSEQQNRQQQLNFVIFAQLTTLLISFGLILTIFITKKKLLCFELVQNEETILENIILIAFIIAQQLPCIYIPYAFYYQHKGPTPSATTVFDFKESDIQSNGQIFKDSLQDDNDAFVNNMIKSE